MYLLGKVQGKILVCRPQTLSKRERALLEQGAGALLSPGRHTLVLSIREVKGFMKEAGKARKDELEGTGALTIYQPLQPCSAS